MAGNALPGSHTKNHGPTHLVGVIKSLNHFPGLEEEEEEGEEGSSN